MLQNQGILIYLEQNSSVGRDLQQSSSPTLFIYLFFKSKWAHLIKSINTCLISRTRTYKKISGPEQYFKWGRYWSPHCPDCIKKKKKNLYYW